MDDETGRPIIGECVICKRILYGENSEYYSDEMYKFGDDLVCEDCLMTYCDKEFKFHG